MSNRRNKQNPVRLRIKGQWIPHDIGLICLLRELPVNARRILDTLEIEHCKQGGRENGRLVCTYTDLERNGGVPRRSIPRTLCDLEALGILRITRGRPAYADFRVPSHYRLTYLPTFVNGKWVEPTHDWKKNQRHSVPRSRGHSAPLLGVKAGAASDTDGGSKPGPSVTLLSRSRGGGVGAKWADVLSAAQPQSPSSNQGRTEPDAPSSPSSNGSAGSIVVPGSGEVH
jgi:hypothetical protein